MGVVSHRSWGGGLLGRLAQGSPEKGEKPREVRARSEGVAWIQMVLLTPEASDGINSRSPWEGWGWCSCLPYYEYWLLLE